MTEAVRRSRMGSVLTDKEVDKAAEYWVKKAFTRISSRYVLIQIKLK